jgi:chaperonin cofactor prefoldin
LKSVVKQYCILKTKLDNIMKNNHVANAFYELVKGSYSEFIEGSDINTELIDIAKKTNIVIPSPDLAILKTTYCEVGVPNKNGDLLPKEAVEKALPTLISKQVNWNHESVRGQICGHIIDAKMDGDLVVIYAVIFKSLFPKQLNQAKKLFKEGSLSVSMEVWDKDPVSGQSVVTVRPDGISVIDPIIFHGCGILIDGELPACPKAYAKKFMACFETKEDDININNLVFSSLAKEEKCLNCINCKCKKEENKLDIFELMFGDNNILQIQSASIEEWEDDYKDIGELVIAKKLTKEEKDALADTSFALVKEVKNQKTAAIKKIRMFNISDQDHVNASLIRIKSANVVETVKKLGFSEEEIVKNIMKSAVNEVKKCSVCGVELKEDEEDTCGVCKTKKASTEEKPKEESIIKAKEEPETGKETKAEPAIAKESSESNPEDKPAGTVKAEVIPPVEVKPHVLMKQIVEEKHTYVIKYVSEVASDNKSEEKWEKTITSEFSDGQKEVITNDMQKVDTYTLEQVNKKIAEVKDAMQKENEKLSTEVATLKAQITEKEQEVSSVKAALRKISDDAPVDLKLGKATVSIGDANEVKKIAKNIDDRAFPKRN